MIAKLDLVMMADHHPSISGISSRRSACDKCRLSKARCLRGHPDQARCDRCFRAGSECVTSPIFRLRSWEPPVVADDHIGNMRNPRRETNKRQRHSDQQQQHPTPSESCVSLGLQSFTASGGHTQANGLVSYQDLGMQGQPSIPNLQDLSCTEGLPEQARVTFGHPQDAFDMNLVEDFFSISAPATSRTDPSTSITSLSSPSTELTSVFVAQSSQDWSPNTVDDNGPRNDKESRQDSEQMPMQRLSKLDYELIAFIVQLDRGSPEETMSHLFKGHGNSLSPSRVDDMLNRTTEYIDILKVITVYDPTPSRSSREALSHSWRQGSVDSRRSSSSSMSSSSYESTTDLPSKSPSSAPPRRPRRELDTPSLLLILSVYIRLLRIHLIVFTNLHDYLEELSESENPHLHSVLQLSISRFPLGKFGTARSMSVNVLNLTIESGNLQTLVLIQIATSLLDKIEGLLGLPREFRLSKRREGGGGIFSKPDCSGLARVILEKEDGGASESGKGGTKALRWHIKKAKQLLRERIAP